MYFQRRVRTARNGYRFMSPSPLWVTKTSSRWASRCRRRTSRNERPLIPCGGVPAGGLQARRQDVDPAHHRVGRGAGLHPAGPGDDHRGANAGVVTVPLAERELRPVVAGEEEERCRPRGAAGPRRRPIRGPGRRWRRRRHTGRRPGGWPGYPRTSAAGSSAAGSSAVCFGHGTCGQFVPTIRQRGLSDRRRESQATAASTQSSWW